MPIPPFAQIKYTTLTALNKRTEEPRNNFKEKQNVTIPPVLGMASQDVAFDALVEGLADTVNTLDTDLKPLIENFKEISSKLPVLDQAKLNVLLAYSIESIIFSV